MAVRGLKELSRKLKAIPKAVRQKSEDSVEAGAKELVSLQKKLAPDGPTGNLKRSIRYEMQDDDRTVARAVVEAGGPLTTKPVREGQDAEYDYALGVEFGTKKHRNSGKFAGTMNPGIEAQPFFYPAYRALRRRMRSRITREMTKGIREAVGK